MAFNLDISKYSESDLKSLFNIQNESFSNSMSQLQVTSWNVYTNL